MSFSRRSLKYSIVNTLRTMTEDGQKPTAKGHLSDSGDLKIFILV